MNAFQGIISVNLQAKFWKDNMSVAGNSSQSKLAVISRLLFPDNLCVCVCVRERERHTHTHTQSHSLGVLFRASYLRKCFPFLFFSLKNKKGNQYICTSHYIRNWNLTDMSLVLSTSRQRVVSKLPQRLERFCAAHSANISIQLQQAKGKQPLIKQTNVSLSCT